MIGIKINMHVTYKTCNLTMRFSKYEFNNKLLGGVTLLRVTPSITWTQLYIYIYIYKLEKVEFFFFFFVG